MLKSDPTPSQTPQSDRLAVRRMLENVREHRLQRNWTQEEMARRTGMSRQAYQNFEGGYGNITLANLMRVLGILGFALRIAELVPEPEDQRTLASVEQAPRQRAREKKRRLS